MMKRKSVKSIHRKHYNKIHIQIIPEPGETEQEFAGRISNILNSYGANIIRATCFGNLSQIQPTLGHLENKLSGINFPLSWTEGGLCTDTFINGLYIHAVSGTASIDPHGKTMYSKDLGKQIEMSYNVVKAILESRSFSFNNIIRSYAYCSDKSFSDTFYHHIKTYLPGKFAFICAENKICHDDLMFEIEVDAVKKTKPDR